MNNLPWITKMDLIGITFALGFAIVAVAIWVVETWRNRRTSGLVNQIKAVELSADTGITIPGLNEFMEQVFESSEKPTPPFHEWRREDGLWESCDSKGRFMAIYGDAMRDDLRRMGREVVQDKPPRGGGEGKEASNG